MSFQIKKFSSIVGSMINWISSATDKVTDFNPGSVVRTIVEAVAMEIEELYYQLLRAVEEAIGESIYRSFNFPRNPAKRATGVVRFYRMEGTEVPIVVPKGTLVATKDDPAIVFETVEDALIPVVTGTATGGSSTRLIDSSTNFVREGVVLGSKVVNVTDGGETPPPGVTAILTTSNENDTLDFSTLTNSASFGSGDEYKVIVPWVDVSVQAVVPGTSGNVAAEAISVIRTSIANVSKVSNLSAFTDGLDEETDSSRKARFALYIRSLSRATKDALEYAARTVEQVVAAKAVDDVRPTVFVCDYGEPIVWTDITLQMRNPSDSGVPLLPEAEGVNDALYIGGQELFEYVNIHLTDVGEIATNNTAWEYWNGSIWSTLFVTDGTNDGSGPLTKSGVLSFEVPQDWTPVAVNGVLAFWIRLRITASGVTYSKTPLGDYASLPPGLGYVYLYCHDGGGELSSTLKALVETAVEGYRGCGIIVRVMAPYKMSCQVSVTLWIDRNYDAEAIKKVVKRSIIDFVNRKVVGEDLYVAEIYHLVMGVHEKAILNCVVNSPARDVVVPSSGILRISEDSVVVSYLLL